MSNKKSKGGIYRIATKAYNQLPKVIEAGELQNYLDDLEQFKGGEMHFSHVTGSRKQVRFSDESGAYSAVEILELSYQYYDNITFKAYILIKHFNGDNVQVEEHWFNNK